MLDLFLDGRALRYPNRGVRREPTQEERRFDVRDATKALHGVGEVRDAVVHQRREGDEGETCEAGYGRLSQ